MTDAAISTLQNNIAFFVISILLTIASCVNGDDDVAYKFLERKPQGLEAWQRMRFVALRFATSMLGGGLMGVGILLVLRWMFPSTIPQSRTILEDQVVLAFLPSMVVVYALIGVVQNIVRRAQGRQQRDVFEKDILKYNISQRGVSLKVVIIGLVLWEMLKRFLAN